MPHTTVLTRDDIERSQAVDLAALLACEAGVQFASNGGRGTATTLFVRGAPTRQVLVLVDGVPLSRQDATGQVGIEQLMLDQIERIEVVRGNVSALYGAGAVGGVIQVFTRGTVPGASALLEAGSRGLLHGAVRAAGGRADGTRWSLALSGERDRGFSALEPATTPAANPDRDGYRNRSAALGLSQQWAPGQSLAANLLHSDGRLDYDSAFDTPADVQTSRTRKNLLQLGSDNMINAAWSSHLRLSTQSDDTLDRTSGAYGYVGRYRTTERAFGWRNELTLSSSTRLQGGVETQRQRITADDGFGDLYEKSRTLWALFGGVQWHSGAHDLALNLRHDDIGGVGSSHSARLGWGYALDAQFKLFASAANAFSAPPLGYLYAPFFGNPDLRPERSRSAELGAQWASGAQRWRATLFQTRVRDELDYDSRTFRFENLSRTRNRGLELSGNGRVGATDWRTSLTAQHPVDGLTGAQRLRRSDTLASIALSHSLGAGLRVGVAARYAGARPDSGNVTLPGYTQADLTAQWDLQRDWQLLG
ncbi:MAG: TonB-dependent receptor, partial [Burkholderiales bacterium]|nr:TonB-dependent receptor [Burkholderiales bacterium]